MTRRYPWLLSCCGMVAFLAACGGGPAADTTNSQSPTAPQITTQPGDQTVSVGQTAAFSVAATGTAPLQFQWRKNGSTITGATGSSYTTPATVSADTGSSFTVVVT